MKLAVCARADDALAAHTEAVARARGHEVLRVAFGQMQSGAPAALALAPEDGASWLWRGEELLACEGVVVRQFPGVHALLAPPEERATAAEWFAKGMAQVERSALAQSFLLDAELRGVPVVNPLLATQPFDHKPLQLAVFQRASLPIPRTLVTNFPEAARLFVDALHEEGRAAITKPAAGGAETLVVDDDVRARLATIGAAPVILQERVVGDDVRVTLVGGEVISSVIVESEDGVDYRRGAAYQRGDAHYRDHPLAPEAAALCARAAALCHHVLSGVDLKRARDGSYHLLEANSAPVYLDIERKTGAPITERVLTWLEASAAARRGAR